MLRWVNILIVLLFYRRNATTPTNMTSGRGRRMREGRRMRGRRRKRR